MVDSSVKFLELIADNNREPMLLLDKQGKIQQANQAAIQIFGLSGDQETSLGDLRIYLLDESPVTWKYMFENIAVLPVIVSCINNKTNSRRIFQFALKVLNPESETTYFLVLTPVQNEVVDLETYRQTEEILFKSFHLSPDAISITRLSDGLFLEVNEGFVQLTGYSRKELIGKTVNDVNLWCIAEEREKMKADLLSDGTSYMEAKYQIKGGEVAEGQISARVINIDRETCLISVVRDLRPQKKIERELRESEKRLQMFNKATNDAIWDWDLKTDKLTWNDGIYRIFGYDSVEIETTVGWWESKIYHEDRKRVIDRLNYFIQQKERTWFDKYRFLRQDGSYAYVYDKGNIICDDSDQPTQMIGGMVDITDRVLAEESLLIRNQQIAEYAFFNSHKVRGPLSRLMGLVALLQHNDKDTERKDLLEKVKITAEEMDRMIHDISKIFY